MGSEENTEILLTVQFKAEGHDLTGEAIASEQSLHAVPLDLSIEHVAQQLVEQMFSIKQSDQHSG